MFQKYHPKNVNEIFEIMLDNVLQRMGTPEDPPWCFQGKFKALSCESHYNLEYNQQLQN